MKHELIEKAAAIIMEKAGRKVDEHCAVTTIDENGYPVSSTMSISKADGVRWLTFASCLDSDRVRRIKKCNRACICLNSAGYHISLVGTIEILTDPQAKRDAWHDESGSDDPKFCALRFTTERYNLYFSENDEGDAGVLSKE